MNKEIVEFDGSVMEGGGQILRIAITISALKKIPIRIKHIRGGRSKPGLMEQHLKGLELVRDLCSAKTKGIVLGSTEIEFWPQEIKGGSYTAQVKTAGSISLLLQIALPCTFFSDSPTTLHLYGGTNTEMAPQIDYITEVFRPILEKFGATFNFDLIKRGYFPKGGGEVVVNVDPIAELKPVELLENGNVTSIYGWSFVAGTLPEKLAHIMANSASSILNKYGSVKIERYKEQRHVATENGCGIILVAETNTNCILGGSALGKRNEKSEETGKRAANELLLSLNNDVCIDRYSQDQVIIFMALAKGPSKIKVGEITMHTQTAIFVVETLTSVKFEITPTGPTTNIISCTGS